VPRPARAPAGPNVTRPAGRSRPASHAFTAPWRETHAVLQRAEAAQDRVRRPRLPGRWSLRPRPGPCAAAGGCDVRSRGRAAANLRSRARDRSADGADPAEPYRASAACQIRCPPPDGAAPGCQLVRLPRVTVTVDCVPLRDRRTGTWSPGLVRGQDRLPGGDPSSRLAGHALDDFASKDAGLGRRAARCHPDPGRLPAGIGDGLRADAERGPARAGDLAGGDELPGNAGGGVTRIAYPIPAAAPPSCGSVAANAGMRLLRSDLRPGLLAWRYGTHWYASLACLSQCCTARFRPAQTKIID
jgi:hypothetical protein